MALDATARRRWFGTISLLVAVSMLVAGETVLKDHLSVRGPFSALVVLGYWLVCFIFTGLAFVTALRDVRALSHRTRQEQRDLVDATLQTIEKEARSKSPHR